MCLGMIEVAPQRSRNVVWKRELGAFSSKATGQVVGRGDAGDVLDEEGMGIESLVGHERLHGEDDVGRSEWRAVIPGDAFAQRDGQR